MAPDIYREVTQLPTPIAKGTVYANPYGTHREVVVKIKPSNKGHERNYKYHK